MESQPLNLAHQQYRRAEAHLKCNRYDEAIKCHRNAAQLLLDAMKSTTSSVALESITLQHSYHLKQEDLIKNKKEQYDRVKKAMEIIKQMGKDPMSKILKNEQAKIEIEIYRTMNMADSLLGALCNDKKESGDSVSNTSAATGRDDIDGKVIEKNKDTVVEELQILNRNLHSLIEQLVTEVEVLKDENMTLKERVNYLEKERTKYLNIQSSEFIEHSNFTNISLENESFTPDLSSEMSGQQNKVYGTGIRAIQQPHFDLSAFKDD